MLHIPTATPSPAPFYPRICSCQVRCLLCRERQVQGLFLCPPGSWGSGSRSGFCPCLSSLTSCSLVAWPLTAVPGGRLLAAQLSTGAGGVCLSGAAAGARWARSGVVRTNFPCSQVQPFLCCAFPTVRQTVLAPLRPHVRRRVLALPRLAV